MAQTVSVVVPVYNCKGYLEKCIESILAQTYPHLQVILVDDGSTDGSGEICDFYAEKDSRIQAIHQNNQGVSAARNAGINLAAGEYLTFADADDTLVPNALETALDVLLQNQTDMVTYGWSIIREDGSSQQMCGEFMVTDDISGVLKEMLQDYAAYGGGYPWNKLWRRDALAEKLPHFDPNLYFFEDLEWVVRMLLTVRRIAVCPQCLYNYYIRESSATNAPEKAERRELGYHHSVEKITENLSALPQLQAWFSEKYYPEIVNGVIHALQHGYRTLLKTMLRKMMQYKEDILCSASVSSKIKLRCRLLILLDIFFPK